MTTIQLANIITEKTSALRGEAVCFAYRILNEYPENFRQAALEIADGKTPAFECGGYKLQDVKLTAGVSDFYALELLRILCRNPEAGKDIIVTLGIRR